MAVARPFLFYTGSGRAKRPSHTSQRSAAPAVAAKMVAGAMAATGVRAALRQRRALKIDGGGGGDGAKVSRVFSQFFNGGFNLVRHFSSRNFAIFRFLWDILRYLARRRQHFPGSAANFTKKSGKNENRPRRPCAFDSRWRPVVSRWHVTKVILRSLGLCLSCWGSAVRTRVLYVYGSIWQLFSWGKRCAC